MRKTHFKRGSELKDAEWSRPAKIEAGYGIGRPMQYELAARGEIEMVSLKATGAKRGVALVNVASVRAMIERRRQAARETAVANT